MFVAIKDNYYAAVLNSNTTDVKQTFLVFWDNLFEYLCGICRMQASAKGAKTSK